MIVIANACRPSLKNQSAKSEKGHFQALIEIPAGTHLKLEYDKASGSIRADQQDGKDRSIDFLGYPGNYGFIPGTLMDEAKGGDGDALDVLVLCDPLASGTLIDILPIGVLRLRDQGELDTKIIAVPMDKAQRSMGVEDFSGFLTKYHMAQQIVQNWFLSYKGYGQVELIGWEDDKYALQAIEKWMED